MEIGRDELIFGVPGVFDDLILLSTDFVAEELEIHPVAPFFQPLSDGGVGFDTVFVAVCLERCLEDGVGITVVRDYDILVATA